MLCNTIYDDMSNKAQLLKLEVKGLTKYLNPKSCIYRTKETIYKLNKPPRNEESDGNREENYTVILASIPSLLR